MESVLKLVLPAQKTMVKEEQNHTGLLEEMKEVSRLLACNDLWFDLECDENLIDACIYQRIALQSRYRYLLQQAKKQGVTASPFRGAV